MDEELKKSLEKIQLNIDTLDKAKEEIKSLQEKQKSIEDELVKFKSIGMMSPEDSKLKKANEKVGFYKSVKHHTYKAAVTETNTEGGYLIPEEFSDDILSFIETYGFMNKKSGISVIPMRTDVIYVPEIAEVNAGYVAAGSNIPLSGITDSRYTLTARKIAHIVNYHNEFLEDATPSTISFIEENAKKAFAKRIDYAIINGNGTLDYTNVGITGILNSAECNVVTMANTASGFANITAEHLSEMIEAVTGVEVKNPKFVFDKTIRHYIRTLKDTAGNYIYEPATNSDVERIWGYPISWMPSGILPGKSASATGKKFGFFGDFSYILYGDRRDMRVAMSEHVGFTSDTTQTKMTMRFDARIIGKGFAVLKTGSGA